MEAIVNKVDGKSPADPRNFKSDNGSDDDGALDGVQIREVEDEHGMKRNVRMLDTATMKELASMLASSMPQNGAAPTGTKPVAGAAPTDKETVISVLHSEMDSQR